MPNWKDFCDLEPKQCSKNIGLERIHMPQINTKNDLKQFKKICKKLNYKTEIKLLKNICNKTIYTSQNEINQTKAEQIPVNNNKIPIVPVIMMKYKKEYMILDGHHRWLAHHLKCSNLYIFQINVNKNLNDSFHNINNELKTHSLNFHKGHTINQTKKRKYIKKNKTKRKL